MPHPPESYGLLDSEPLYPLAVYTDNIIAFGRKQFASSAAPSRSQDPGAGRWTWTYTRTPLLGYAGRFAARHRRPSSSITDSDAWTLLLRLPGPESCRADANAGDALHERAEGRGRWTLLLELVFSIPRGTLHLLRHRRPPAHRVNDSARPIPQDALAARLTTEVLVGLRKAATIVPVRQCAQFAGWIVGDFAGYWPMGAGDLLLRSFRPGGATMGPPQHVRQCAGESEGGRRLRGGRIRSDTPKTAPPTSSSARRAGGLLTAAIRSAWESEGPA